MSASRQCWTALISSQGAPATHPSRRSISDAVAFSEKSIRLVPNGLRGYALKANVYRHLKDFKRSAEALGMMASLKPDDPSIRMGLGDMEYQDGNREGARLDWQRALQLSPADALQLRKTLELRISGETLRGHLPMKSNARWQNWLLAGIVAALLLAAGIARRFAGPGSASTITARSPGHRTLGLITKVPSGRSGGPRKVSPGSPICWIVDLGTGVV